MVYCLLTITHCIYFHLLVCCRTQSTTGGENGSADTVRDPRGFALKFYTEEGNWDLVGNNTPIFFIRDPILVSYEGKWCVLMPVGMDVHTMYDIVWYISMNMYVFLVHVFWEWEL